ncbi:MAG: hypothetical protein NT010_06680 [Proteobacteria bacterium]|nr:hypothetical protein [Pseudomonadota bacterium]
MDEKSIMIIGSETKADRRFARNAALLLIDRSGGETHERTAPNRKEEKNDN